MASILVVLLTLLFVNAAQLVSFGDPACELARDYLLREGVGEPVVETENAGQSARNDPVCLQNSCCRQSSEILMVNKSAVDLGAHFKMVIEPQRNFIHLLMNSFKRKCAL